MRRITRRKFLKDCASATAGASLWPGTARSATNAQPSIKFPSAAHDRVAIASYPFREFIAGKEHKRGNPTIELKSFGAHVVDKFHVYRIEPWSAHFASTDASYLAEFREALEKARVSVVNVAVDSESSPYSADRAERERAVGFSKQWIDIALALGSPSVRTNIPEAKNAKPDAGLLVESLRQVIEYASTKHVVVHLENDNPVSEDPFFLVQVVQKVNSPWLHTLPDFGNTLNAHDEDYAYRAIDAMFGQAYGICHVKNGEVNEQGRATHVDLARTFAILKQRGYKGYCSIEYDAPGDPYQATAELVRKTIAYLSPRAGVKQNPAPSK
jgi:sugar phosphate isomerase/epimerase